VTETIEKNPVLRRKMNRFGMSMFILSQVIPLIVLIDVRYLFVGLYVSPHLDQGVGLASALFMLLSMVVAWQVKTRAARGEDLTPRLKWVLLLGALALLALFYQWSWRLVSPADRFGEVYYTMTGFAVFYAVVGLVGLLSALSRARFQLPDPDDTWHLEAVSYLWTGIGLIWVLTYVVLFLI
jgi:heme/copper-type cytochrome/quinol oxidase subunit 3